jgi:hypothetical protein
MNKVVLSLLLVGHFSFSAQAEEFRGNVFAIGACDSGCFPVHQNYNNGYIYYGVTAKTYRICASGVSDASIKVDNSELTLPASSEFMKQKECVDVNGKIIFHSGGHIQVGILP